MQTIIFDYFLTKTQNGESFNISYLIIVQKNDQMLLFIEVNALSYHLASLQACH